jgi:hypothetical protein
MSTLILMADVEEDSNMTTEKETCKVCGIPIQEGDTIISVDEGTMEYVDDDGRLPINQSSTPKGYWHKDCFPGKIIE